MPRHAVAQRDRGPNAAASSTAATERRRAGDRGSVSAPARSTPKIQAHIVERRQNDPPLRDEPDREHRRRRYLHRPSSSSDDDSGEGAHIAKVPTTVDNQAYGVLAALDAAGVDPPSLRRYRPRHDDDDLNAMLEAQDLLTVGLIDDARLSRRPRAWPAHAADTVRPEGQVRALDRAPPARSRVDERMDAEGDGAGAARRGPGRSGACALLALGAEERRRPLPAQLPQPGARAARRGDRAQPLAEPLYVTAGHDVVAEYREYERGTTAAVNAAIQPVLHRYIERLQKRSSPTAAASRGELLVMQGNGGTVAWQALVTEHAVATVMSGPASGVIAAAATALRQAWPVPCPRRVRRRRHLRHGRHLERRRPDPRRPALGLELNSSRVRDADPRADGRRARRSSAGGTARSPRSMPRGCSRSARTSAGATPGADLLRPRRHARHHHRRQPAARPARSRTKLLVGRATRCAMERIRAHLRGAGRRAPLGSASTRRPPPFYASPTTRWPARSAW